MSAFGVPIMKIKCTGSGLLSNRTPALLRPIASTILSTQSVRA